MKSRTIIRYTNPQRVMGVGGTSWKCAVCGAKFTDPEAARKCAEADHRRKARRRKETGRA